MLLWLMMAGTETVRLDRLHLFITSEEMGSMARLLCTIVA